MSPHKQMGQTSHDDASNGCKERAVSSRMHYRAEVQEKGKNLLVRNVQNVLKSCEDSGLHCTKRLKGNLVAIRQNMKMMIDSKSFFAI